MKNTTRLLLGLAGTAFLGWPPTSDAAINAVEGLEVRVLYDNSGSMHPGYSPGSGRRRSTLGVGFFYDYPEFCSWLDDFVARQEILGGRSVEMKALTSSGGSFRAGDITLAHPKVPLDTFDGDRACQELARLPFGRHTFLKEGLEAYTAEFEGLVWLITDNIVEDGRGGPDQGVLDFFRGLNTTDRYRSIQLFKLPFEDPARDERADLAVYGLLVSPEAVANAAYFDRKFRDEFRQANRITGDPQAKLFRGQEHLKLKDLRIDAFELKLPRRLEVRIARGKNLFREKQTVTLPLPGEIRSNLTQHTVTEGRYSMSVGEFRPDEESRERFGVQAIPKGTFGSASEALDRPIPPTSTRPFEIELNSREPISISTSGFWAWVSAALHGVQVKYEGTARLAFGQIRVELQRDRMEGIFGAEVAPEVFKFQDRETIPVDPTTAKVSFQVQGGSQRGLLLLLLVLFVLIPFLLLAWFLLKTASYRVLVGEQPPRGVTLRRLQSHRVAYGGTPLGVLGRDLLGRHGFRPAASLRDQRPGPPSQPGSWDLTLAGGQTVRLLIEPVGGGAGKASTRRSGSRTIRGPGAPPPGPAKGGGAGASEPSPGSDQPTKAPRRAETTRWEASQETEDAWTARLDN